MNGKMEARFLHFVSSIVNCKDIVLVQAQGRDFGIFVLEQTSALRFNRGMLLNSGVALLAGSDYDYFVFHDVDTVPTETGAIPYDYPYGRRVWHLYPHADVSNYQIIFC